MNIPQDKVRAITSVVKVLSVAAGLSAYQQYIPEKYAPIAVLVFLAVSASKDVLIVLGDYLDNGKRDNSFQG